VFREIILIYSVLLSHSDVTCSDGLKLGHLNISSRIFNITNIRHINSFYKHPSYWLEKFGFY